MKDNRECLDHLGMINALNIMLKLQPKHWVDSDIEKLIADLVLFFESNYQDFTSFEKWAK